MLQSECLLDAFFIFEIQQLARFSLLWVYYYYFSWNRVSFLSSPYKSFISQRFSSIVNINIVAFFVVVISSRYRSYLYIRSPLLVCHINHIPSKCFIFLILFPSILGDFQKSFSNLCSMLASSFHRFNSASNSILRILRYYWSQIYSLNPSNCLSIWVYLVPSSFIPFLWSSWECKVVAV